jgi:hypothetical protein
MSLQLGYARQPITPDLDRPVFLAGFGNNRRATDIHDDLWIRALALRDADHTIVLTALDLIGLSRVHVLEIEQRSTAINPGMQLLLACTHTHHAPDTLGLWGPDDMTCGVDAVYLARLKDQVVETVCYALQEVQPVETVKSAATPIAGWMKNYRDPDIVDNELTCLQFSATDRVLATIAIFPCHPEVLWSENPVITSDYPHTLRRTIEEQTHAPCLFFSGALGGMQSPDVPERNFENAEAMGVALAQAGLQALTEAEPQGVEAFTHLRREYSVPLTNPVFYAAQQRGLLPSIVRGDGTLLTETNLLKIGATWFITAPGELLPKLGLALKVDLHRSGACEAAVIGLLNDELGYILPIEEFVFPDNPFEPGDHYEETMSIGPEAGPRLLEEARELINA